MASTRDKVLFGLAGVVGAGVVSWKTMFPWIGYDLTFIKQGAKTGKKLNHDIQTGRFLIEMFDEAVAKHPLKPFVIFEDRVYTYQFMDEQANRVANIASTWGLKPEECVAMMIENEPSFIWTFLGLQKLNISVAFINFHIKGGPLVHTIKACEAKVLILGSQKHIYENVDNIRGEIENIPVYVQGNNELGAGYQSWDKLMFSTLPVPPCKTMRATMNIFSPCCYIFTSGTTGLPKPAIISQAKAIGVSKFFQFFNFNPTDIIYTCTPLYHSAAGGLGLMNTLDQGATMVLVRKFSANRYFADVRRHNVTVIQYIGELCRYLLSVPENPLDGQHNVRLAVGNGLRSDIWDQFKTRYNIPIIYEFFGATEGTAATMNLSNRKGACGRYSPLLNKLEPTAKYIVKVDVDTGEVKRDKSGLCIPVGPNEPGLLLGAIPPQFTGNFYKGGKELNEKKTIRNVRVEGDAYFNFGDLMMYDKDYFVYFKDRIGDTFRWKGENVATYEVSNVLTKLDVIHDANVYGVEVPGSEGRAGMAAIHLENNAEITPTILRQIFHHCEENLPAYARPLFLRFPAEVAMTTTHKQQKTHLRKEGFHPQDIDDPLFYYDKAGKTYSPLTVETYGQFLTKSKL